MRRQLADATFCVAHVAQHTIPQGSSLQTPDSKVQTIRRKTPLYHVGLHTIRGGRIGPGCSGLVTQP